MRAFFHKQLDRLVIRMAAAQWRGGRDIAPHLHEAEQLLREPDLFMPDVKSAAVEFYGKNKFQFPSPIVSRHPENNIVHGRFFPCAGRWNEKPAILLLHGLNDAANHWFYYPWLCRALRRQGVNAATLEFPYHFQRRATTPDGRNFISADVLHTLDATRQALMEIRAFTQWLKNQGCAKVGRWGISMGGWLAGLTVCHDSQFGCAVLIDPVASMQRFVREIEFCAPIRSSLQGASFDLTRMDLLSHQPKLPRDNILLVEAEYDQFVPRETLEQLRQNWGGVETWRFPCGHIGI